MPRPIQQRNTTRYPGVYWVQLRNDNKAFFIRYRLPDRKQIEERAGTSAQGMTAAKASAMRASRISGKTDPNNKRREAKKELESKIQWTLARLWEEYSETRSSDSGRPYKSRGRDENRFKKHFPDIWHLLPEQIDHLHYERWEKNISTGRSPTTVWHCGELLRRIVRFGTEKNLCNGLPFKLSLRKIDNRTTEYLEPEQLNKLAEALKLEEPITGNLFRIVLLTGLRRGELLKLRWEDINFEKGIVQLRDTKAGRDQTLPLSEQAFSLLENHPRHQSNCDYVFPSPQGCQWSKSSLDRVFKRIAARSNLPKGFRLLHGLRHQYGSMLAENGANIVELRDLLRHSDVRVSERYLHSSDERLRKRANVLGSQQGT